MFAAATLNPQEGASGKLAALALAGRGSLTRMCPLALDGSDAGGLTVAN
jgi:hypothetical protein